MYVYFVSWGVDVLKEFASKKCGKLGKLLKERGGNGVQMKHRDSTVQNPSPSSKFDSDPTKVNKFHVNATKFSVSNGFFFPRATN